MLPVLLHGASHNQDVPGCKIQDNLVFSVLLLPQDKVPSSPEGHRSNGGSSTIQRLIICRHSRRHNSITRQ
jgi:hypothetical protein